MIRTLAAACAALAAARRRRLGAIPRRSGRPSQAQAGGHRHRRPGAHRRPGRERRRRRRRADLPLARSRHHRHGFGASRGAKRCARTRCKGLDTAGLSEVSVTRASRTFRPEEIENVDRARARRQIRARRRQGHLAQSRQRTAPAARGAERQGRAARRPHHLRRAQRPLLRDARHAERPRRPLSRCGLSGRATAMRGSGDGGGAGRARRDAERRRHTDGAPPARAARPRRHHRPRQGGRHGRAHRAASRAGRCAPPN